MKNTLIVLGNGFDLDLGWKTSYNDFYSARQHVFHGYDGMPYIKNLITEEHWFDFEGYMRNCLVKLTKERITEMQEFWMICKSQIFEYFKPEDDKSKWYITDKNSCAYKFLTHITEQSDIVSFNYTDPFKKNNIIRPNIEFIHIHGNIDILDDYSKVKIGVDSFVQEENMFANDPKILDIIKSENNPYQDKLLQKLKTSKNVIFYGHSLGQPDADYFKSYFDKIVLGKIRGKNIFIITKNVWGTERSV